MATNRVKYENWAVDSSGDIVAGAAVEVRRLYDNTLATVYSGDTGGGTQTNPLNAGADGKYTLYMDPGAYTITVGTAPTSSSHSVYLVEAPSLFATRAAAVTAIAAGFVLPDNSVFRAGDEAYLWDGGTAIADMPGAAPYDASLATDCWPEHFGDVTTALRASAQAAVDYAIDLGSGLLGRGGVVGFGSKAYTVDSLDADGRFLTTDDTVVLRGNGKNVTQLTMNSATGTLIYVGKGDAAIAADEDGSEVVRDAEIRDMYLENTYYDAGPPTAGQAVLVDRSNALIMNCKVRGFYRGFTGAGTIEGLRIIGNDIELGLNNGATGWATAETDSAAVAIVRRQVNAVYGAAVAAAVQDSADSQYYWYSNSVYMSDNNVRCGALAAQRGAEYSLLVEGADGLYATNNHWAWGREAAAAWGYRQTNAIFNNMAFSADLFDPLPGESNYGVLVNDLWSVGSANSAPIKALMINGGHIAGAVLDLYSVQCRLTRSALVGCELKGATRNGVRIANAGIEGLIIGFNSIYNTDDDADGDFDAAVYVTACASATILGNAIGLGSRGVQALTGAAGLSIVNTYFYDLSYSAVTRDAIFLASGITGVKRITGNIGTLSTTIASASEIYLPVGDDIFDITGTTTINTVQVTSPTSFYPGRVFTLRMPANGSIGSAAIGSTTAGTMILRDGFDYRSESGDTITFIVDDNNVAHEIGRSGLTVNQVSVADDGVATIPLPVSVGYLTVAAANSPNACALIRFRAGSGVENVTTIQAGSITTVVTTALTGTTGTDGELTIGINNDTLYIENRMGGGVEFNYKLIG